MKQDKIVIGIDIQPSFISIAVIKNGYIEECIAEHCSEIVPSEHAATALTRSQERNLSRRIRNYYKTKRGRKESLESFLKELNLYSDNNIDPFLIRYHLLDNKGTPEEIARFILTMFKRRGMPTEKKTITGKKENIISIEQTQKDMMGYRTLGEALYLNPDLPKTKRSLTRNMIETEFDVVMKKQCEFHPYLLLHVDDIKKLIFKQTPNKSQKHLVGNCSILSKYKRAHTSHPVFEIFRTLSLINNIKIRIDDEYLVLSKEEKILLFEKACISAQDKIEFKSFTQPLKNKNYSYNYNSDQYVKINKTLRLFKKILSEQDWNRLVINFEDPDLLIYLWKIIYESKEIYNTNDIKGLERIPLQLNDNALEICKEAEICNGYSNLSTKVMIEAIPRLLDNITEFDAFTEIKKRYDIPENVKTDFIESIPKTTNFKVNNILALTKKHINNIIAKYGIPDYIRVEMVRDIAMTREEREKFNKELNFYTTRRTEAKKQLTALGVANTEDNIDSAILFFEQNGRTPLYDITYNLIDCFNGKLQKDHIVPFDISWDDSLFNRMLIPSVDNRVKHKLTPYQAYSGDEVKWEIIKKRAKHIFTKKNGKEILSDLKYNHYISEYEQTGFTNKHLTETAYIAREVIKLLKPVCKKTIQVTKGVITANLRKVWDLDNLLGTETKNRMDLRHHIVDSIVCAYTQPYMVKDITDFINRDLKIYPGLIPPPIPEFKKHIIEFVDRIFINHEKKKRHDKDGNILLNGPMHDQNFYGNVENMFNFKVKSFKQIVDIPCQKTKRQIISNLSKIMNQNITDQYLIDYNDKKQEKEWLKIINEIDIKIVDKSLQKNDVLKPIDNIYTKRVDLKSLTFAMIRKIADPCVKSKIMQALSVIMNCVVDDAYLNKSQDKKIVSSAIQRLAKTQIYMTDKMGNRKSNTPLIKSVRVLCTENNMLKLDKYNKYAPKNNNAFTDIVEIDNKLNVSTIARVDYATGKYRTKGILKHRFIIDDMYIIGIPENELKDKSPEIISQHLYRVCKNSNGRVVFMHHLTRTKQDKYKNGAHGVIIDKSGNALSKQIMIQVKIKNNSIFDMNGKKII